MTLNGVAIVRLEPSDGVTQTAEFTHSFSALAPGATINFADVWDSTGAVSETYRVVGYVKYALDVSAPQTTTITVFVPVTGVTLARIGTETVYTNTLVQFSVDIAPDDASKPTRTINYDDGTVVTAVSSEDP